MNTLPPSNRFSATSAVPLAGDGIEIIGDIGGFDATGCAWRDLFHRAGTPHQVFQRFEFLRIWARHYLDRRARLHIVTFHRAGRLAAVVPLLRQRHFGLDVLRLMGAPVAQFDDAVLEPELSASEREAIWHAIRGSGADCLLLRRVRADAAIHALLPDRLVRFEALRAPFADLAQRVDKDAPGPAYSARDRSNHRRRLRRLAEAGEVRLAVEPPGEAGAALALRAIDLKRSSLGQQGTPSLTVSDPRFGAFFADAARDPDAALSISSISLDARPIAVDLSFDCKGRGFGHVIATDPAFEREGVGQLLIHHVFAAAARRGNTAFELMAPQDRYKLRHADGATAVESLAVPFTLRGRLFAPLVFRYGLPVAKAVARRIPASLMRYRTG